MKDSSDPLLFSMFESVMRPTSNESVLRLSSIPITLLMWSVRGKRNRDVILSAFRASPAITSDLSDTLQ